MDASLNVIIFGAPCAGKSSTVNLIAGKEISFLGWESTLEPRRYTFDVAKRTFNVWVTIGLTEPIFGLEGYLGAIEKTCSLIQQIAAEGGLDLLLFCIPANGSRISQTTLCNYRLFYEVLCEKKVPIALVVTHLEREGNMDDWWTRNEGYLSSCGLDFSGHACVTGLRGHKKERESRSALEHLLLGYDHRGRYTMPSASDWIYDVLAQLVANNIHGKKGGNSKEARMELERILRDRAAINRKNKNRLFSDLLERLASDVRSKTLKVKQKSKEPARSSCNRSMTDGADAGRIAKTPARHASSSPSSAPNYTPQSRPVMRSSFNIILFGEAGVGKSSVINLIAGRDIAKTSGDAWGCTLESKQYTFSVAERTFNIWDTVGLGEPVFSATDYLLAIEKTYTLIQQIKAKGGLDLLLFCIPGSGSRITQTMVCNYRLFFEVFCEKRIPISVVVTRLEGLTKMDEWWDRNGEYVNQSGLSFGGHACVTGDREHANAAQGRAALELLLLGYDHKGRYPMPSASDWFSGFLKRLPVIPRPKALKYKQKELERLLRNRCMMESTDAQQIAETLTCPRKQDP